MYKLLPFKAVENLIAEGGYGNYRLYSLPGNELLAGSHLTEDKTAAGSLPTEGLLAHINKTIDLIGDGDFKIVLKKNHLGTSQTEVTHRFQVRNENNSPQLGAQNNGYSGLGAEQIETMVNARVAQIMEKEKEKQVYQDKVKELETELKQLKAARFKKKPTHWLKELGQLGKMGAAVLISERWPNAVPLVEKVIAKFDGEDDEEEEEEETGFTRPPETE